MASIVPLPPTPQQSFSPSHMLPAASPPQPSSQAHGLPATSSSFGHGYGMSFEGQSSHSQSQPAHSFSQSFPSASQQHASSYPNGPVSTAAYPYPGRPQIYTAVYSGVSVYEMEIQGVACMRRRSDGWLNATQILKVAGVDKGKRTKVLEKEILTGEHEKVQGGYGKYQGTWISYKRGREFCRQYGVEDILRPLLDYDVSADGSGGQGQQDTPTKEQAMAANRKRFYNTGVDATRPNGGPLSNGTFFQNISPSTSVALAAMNKAARLQSPAPRPPSAQRPPSFRQHNHQDAFPGGSQQSMMSEGSFSFEPKSDSGYGTHANGEPPRKRMRSDSRDGVAPVGLPMDVSMRSETPTEPNESFVYEGVMTQELTNVNGDPIALGPLPHPATDDQQDKAGLIMDLFAEAGRTDYGNHPALLQLSGEDLNLPLDASANNALHWAATLAKVPLLKLLIKKGANIQRGNAAGQSPLISAVLVNNCWEHSCFPELLELLGSLIEVRDLQGRTILHHIAVSSGIKGRAPSSKYYLEALLEFLVRIGTQPNAAGGGQAAAAVMARVHADQSNSDNIAASSQDLVLGGSLVQSSTGGLTLVKFLSEVVNAKDKAGNTALNLVARIGNRSIIQQLLEIHADPTLPNNKGVSARDFGIGDTAGVYAPVNGSLASQQIAEKSGNTLDAIGDDDEADEVRNSTNSSQVESQSQDVISTMTSMLTQSLTSHKELLRQRTEQIDQLNQQIKEFSNQQKDDLAGLAEIEQRVRVRNERRAKIANLRRSITEKRSASNQRSSLPSNPSLSSNRNDDDDLQPSWLDQSSQEILAFDSSGDGSPNGLQRQFLSANIPHSPTSLRARLNAYVANNASLQKQANELKSRSSELEGMYRKVVALCTGVAEDKVEENLGALVAAVESEKGALGEQEAGRVRDFLRHVDGGGTVAGSSATASAPGFMAGATGGVEI